MAVHCVLVDSAGIYTTTDVIPLLRRVLAENRLLV